MNAFSQDHPYERIVAALRHRGARIQVRSSLSVRATCPAHSDRDPSLVVTRRDDRALIRCFAGCRTSDVVMALGLRMADLFSGKPGSHASRPHEVAAYDYCDLDGVVTATKVRLEPKAFRWRVPTPDGGTRWGLQGAAMPGLYRWPDLLDAGRVLVTEGEKATDRLAALGFAATCPPAGASTWRPAWSLDLWHAGCREVIVLADSDRTGREHAERVASACYAVSERPHEAPIASDEPWKTWAPTSPGITDPEIAALRVKVLELPTMPGGDVSDWLAAGHTADELTAIIEAAPYWRPHGVELERAERKRALTRDRVRRFRERRRAERLRPVAVTLRTVQGCNA